MMDGSQKKVGEDNWLLYVAGSDKAFICDCGCNVFRVVLGTDEELYCCNGCLSFYRANRVDPMANEDADAK